ncbi:MAG: LysR family transcriptional regulator [Francisellaceae bacterium]
MSGKNNLFYYTQRYQQDDEDSKSMKLEKLTISLLNIFESVIRNQSVNRAAEELFLTPTAISNALIRLRDIFDDPLFIRRNNLLNPTIRAKELMPDLLQIIALIKKMSKHDIYDPFKKKQHFRLGMTPVTKHALQARIVRLLSEYPISLEIKSIDYHYPPKATEYPDFDFMIGMIKPADQFHNVKVYEEYIAVVGDKKNKVLAKPDFTIEDYIRLRHVRIHNVAVDQNPVLNVIGTPDPRDIFIELDEFGDFISIISDSDLVATTSLAIADIYNKNNGHKLAIRLLPTHPIVEYYVSWPTIVDTDPGNIWLRNLLFEKIQPSVHVPDIPKLDQAHKASSSTKKR